MRRFFSLTMVLLATGLIAGCGSNTPESLPVTTTNTPNMMSSPSTNTTSNTSYTLENVAQHATANDCWVVINSNVYNVTTYIPNHPGGDAILQGCGKDATAMFGGDNMWGKMHSGAARMTLNKYAIGSLSQ